MDLQDKEHFSRQESSTFDIMSDEIKFKLVKI